LKRNWEWTRVGRAKAAAKPKAEPKAPTTKATGRAARLAAATARTGVDYTPNGQLAAKATVTPDEDAVRILREAGDLAEPAQPKRTRRPAADRPPVAAFGRGELRDAVIGYLQNMPDGVTATAGDIARELNAHTAPVGTNLARMVKAGTAVQIFGEGSGAPARYRAA